MSRSRNTKHWGKPGKVFKRIAQQQRRAREKQAMKEAIQLVDCSCIPKRAPKTDTWDWN